MVVDSLKAVFEKGVLMAKNGDDHSALTLFTHCARAAKEPNLFFLALLEITSLLPRFGQFFAAYCICSSCERMAQHLWTAREIDERMVSAWSPRRVKLLEDHAKDIDERIVQANSILSRISRSRLQFENAYDLCDSLHYMSSTLECDSPAFPLFHSFRTKIPFSDKAGFASEAFDLEFKIFELAGSADVEERFDLLTSRVNANCGFSSKCLCFARGRESKIGIILSFQPEQKRQFWYFCTGCVPPFSLVKVSGGHIEGDWVPGAYQCIELGIDAEQHGDLNNAASWYALGASLGSASDDLESALNSLVHYARGCLKEGDLRSNIMAKADIEKGQSYHRFESVSRLIETGYLECLGGADRESKRAERGRSVFDAPTSEISPKGTTSGSNKREYYALVDLYEGWETEFPDIEVPLSKPQAFVSIGSGADGFLFSEYRDLPTGQRLSQVNDLLILRQNGLVNPDLFAQNLFGTLRVAHRRIWGSFTNDAGSGVSSSNVTLAGEIKDLETFHSPRYGDPLVPLEYFIEDLMRATETLADLCAKLGSTPRESKDTCRKALRAGIKMYAQQQSVGIVISSGLLNALFKSHSNIPSSAAPSGSELLKFGSQLYYAAASEEPPSNA